MSPSAAVNLVEGNGLHIWTHTQGIHPLRREIATYLDLPSMLGDLCAARGKDGTIRAWRARRLVTPPTSNSA